MRRRSMWADLDADDDMDFTEHMRILNRDNLARRARRQRHLRQIGEVDLQAFREAAETRRARRIYKAIQETRSDPDMKNLGYIIADYAKGGVISRNKTYDVVIDPLDKIGDISHLYSSGIGGFVKDEEKEDAFGFKEFMKAQKTLQTGRPITLLEIDPLDHLPLVPEGRTRGERVIRELH